MQTDTVVSSDSENLILVNEQDEDTGQLSKLECHLNGGILHRAFSIFIVNDKGQLLLQQRSAQKFLWPMYWSNACCSHPRVGETIQEAVHRRLEQELGFTTELKYLYKFIYKAQFEDKGTEHELCSVWIGRYNGEDGKGSKREKGEQGEKPGDIRVNRNEIAAWRFIDPSDLDRDLIENPGQYTPWMKMEWETIKRDHPDDLSR